MLINGHFKCPWYALDMWIHACSTKVCTPLLCPPTTGQSNNLTLCDIRKHNTIEVMKHHLCSRTFPDRTRHISHSQSQNALSEIHINWVQFNAIKKRNWKKTYILNISTCLEPRTIHVLHIYLHLPSPNQTHVGKYTIHGWYGVFPHFLRAVIFSIFLRPCFWKTATWTACTIWGSSLPHQ